VPKQSLGEKWRSQVQLGNEGEHHRKLLQAGSLRYWIKKGRTHRSAPTVWWAVPTLHFEGNRGDGVSTGWKPVDTNP